MAIVGHMDHRIVFEKKKTGQDGYGNTVTAGWDTHFRCWAAFRPKFGREQLEADRLESTFTGVLTVRSNTESRGVTPDMRVRFIGGPYEGKECQVRSIVPTDDKTVIEMTLEEGVAL